MKRTKKTKPQMTLALPLDPAAPNAELEAAVRAAEASFLAKAEPEESPSDAAPSNGEPVVLPQATVFVAARPSAETKIPEYVDAARSGRNTLYIVTAVKWGEMQARKGKRMGWQRLPDTGFKAKGQALQAAEQMVEAGRATGAMAIQQTADPDAGDYDEPLILGSFGRLPEGFAEI